MDSSVIQLFEAMESGKSDVPEFVSLALPTENKNIGVAWTHRATTPLRTTQDILNELIVVAEKSEVVKNPNKPRCILLKTPQRLVFLFW